jgi:hypothetical protein
MGWHVLIPSSVLAKFTITMKIAGEESFMSELKASAILKRQLVHIVKVYHIHLGGRKFQYKQLFCKKKEELSLQGIYFNC